MATKVTILDGGFSSQISRHVGDRIDGDPLWTARFLSTRPDAITQTHLDFLRAGSEIIETNTYQASIGGFKKYLSLDENGAKNLIKSAAKLAQKAIDQYRIEKPDAAPQIAGSIGPYGAALHDGSEYTGSYTDLKEEVLREWHKPRIEALMECGITLLAIETIPCALEALVLASLIKDYPATKAWISFSCKDEKFLAHGELFHEVATRVYSSNPEQILAVGVNCLNPLNVSTLLKPINEGRQNKIALIVYPNSGEKYKAGQWSNEEPVAPIEDFIEEWIAVGVKYIGGCCRTYTEQISSIKEKLVKLSLNK